MRFRHWFLGLVRRNFLFHGARLISQSGVKRLESEPDWNLGANAVSAFVPGFRSAELSVSRSSTKSQIGVKRLRDEHDRDPTFNAFLALKVEAR